MSKPRARERKKKRKALSASSFGALPYEVQSGDYVVIAPDGTKVPLGPEVFGDDWPRARRMLAEIDRSSLPSVKEAQEIQAAKMLSGEKNRD